MATHSSILDWEIPWTEEPGRLQSLGSQEPDITGHTYSCIVLNVQPSITREEPQGQPLGQEISPSLWNLSLVR